MIAVAMNLHDHNTFDGKYHCMAERLSRTKHNYNSEIVDFSFMDCFFRKDEVVSFSTTNNGILSNPKFRTWLESDKKFYKQILEFNPDTIWDRITKDNYYYVDHHCSHAVYAYLTSGFDKSDILAIDGNGMSSKKSIFVDESGKITDLSDVLPLGKLWNLVTFSIGFEHLEEGKTMGLSAYGRYDPKIYSILNYVFEDIRNPDNLIALSGLDKKDLAYNVQHFTIQKIREIVLPLKTSANICIAGGVAYNGYMNEEFTKHYEKVYVPPAPGDEGQSIGCYMHANYTLNNKVDIPSVYSGKSYNTQSDTELDYKFIAQKIADGAIVGWFQDRSESGNRALGNRSILADPRNPQIKNIINSKIKKREDFRPFAPSVLEEYYKEYFDTNQPSPYMSRIVPVISDKIPGVTHVDKTARIQTVNQKQNEKYYRIINEFYNITGVPMLLNTSFNCHEPIVETPQEAFSTFTRTDLDMLVRNNSIIEK